MTHNAHPGWLAPILLLLATSSPGGSAWAQPTVRVLASTRIELEAERTPGAIRITGVVSDDLDRPLPGRDVLVTATPESPELPARRKRLRSDDRGRFGVDLELPLGRYRITAVHAGDTHHAATEHSQPLDLTRAPVRLRIVEPAERRIELGRGSVPIVVEASSAAGGDGLAVRLEDELQRPLGEGRTDARGRFAIEVDAERLGAPGTGRLTADSEGDDRRLPGRAGRSVVRFVGTTLELSARVVEGELRARGRLTTADGGLERRAVGLYLDGDHLATVLTDAEGRFAHRHRPAARPRQAQLEARFDSDAPWWGPSRARPVAVRLGQPPPPSPLWLLLPLLAVLIALRLLGRRERRAQAEEAAAQPRPPAAGVLAGTARPSLRPGNSRVAGQVLDVARGLALPDAEIALEGPSPCDLTCDAEGRFASDDLAPGSYRLSVSAPGFATEQATLAVPHRGEWASLRVGLESLRDRALHAYRPVAEAVLPQPRLWERWTLRETLGHARRGAHGDALEALTGRTERAAYAAPLPTEQDVEAISRDGQRVLERLENGAEVATGEGPSDDRERGP